MKASGKMQLLKDRQNLNIWMQKTLAEGEEFLYKNQCHTKTMNKEDKAFKFLPQGVWGLFCFTFFILK